MTIEIPLTRGRVTIVDDVDSDLAEMKWCTLAAGAHFYSCRLVRPKKILMHRVILSRMLGRDLLSGEMVDHINGNPLDNRRCNLRLATNAENTRNQGRHKDSTSGYKGASWHKAGQKWQAQIMANGQMKYLGLFDTAELAHKAYCTAARELHGEFANDGNQPLGTDE